MQKFSYLKSINADYIDEMFTQYSRDPGSVDDSWRYFFEGIELGDGGLPNGHSTTSVTSAAASAGVDLSSEAKVTELIQAYRRYGKLLANVNPLSPAPSSVRNLELETVGLTNADLTKTFQAGKLLGLGPSRLSDIIARLRQIYCGSIAVEISQIDNREMREWLQKRLETTGGRESLDADTRKFILKRLTESESFERFLHTRYVAQKRFSVEGGESIIPALDCSIEAGAELGAQEFIIGMAHRGRLNVLTNIFGKKSEYMFSEFEGNYKIDYNSGEGDVKYHKGYSTDFKTRHGKQVHLSLGFNPSHLEFINPVVEGMARAKQDKSADLGRSKVVPILIHGDAAFAGQGVCYETLNFAQLPGYATGGTIHFVINNQVGFTADPSDARSSTYCTDVAKMLDAPIFHVNGDDAEAVWFVSKVCMEYRQKFKNDAFVDLVCYRKHGHNEGDEPSFTQPLLYKKIKVHSSPREVYAQQLIQAGALTDQDAQKMVDDIMAGFTAAQQKAKAENPAPKTSVFERNWKGMKKADDADLFKPVRTAVEASTLRSIASKINSIPAGFHLHSKLARFFDARLKSVEEGKGIDWGNGEALAYASLIAEGHPVRLSGQDAERGTFTHRHSILHDSETGEQYSPINAVATTEAKYQVYNSHLSETGVMGYEYGYSLAAPNSLVIWEAQFGDFANGAQVIIDQFLTTSESKWQRMSGLTLLLPHSYEGQGPEHSSARLERFLQLTGKNNIFVCNLTTPAQIFHALRRQVKWDFRKPLVIMSPKSLLRHPQAISTLEEFSQGQFEEVIDDRDLSQSADAGKVKTVMLCSGKVYYELLAEKTARKRSDVAIVRLEQFYPFPKQKLASILGRYAGAKDILWVQEEPRNMGAWTFLFNIWMGGLDNFQAQIGNRPIRYVGREIAASPAVGSHKWHEMEQKALHEAAFTLKG